MKLQMRMRWVTGLFLVVCGGLAYAQDSGAEPGRGTAETVSDAVPLGEERAVSDRGQETAASDAKTERTQQRQATVDIAFQGRFVDDVGLPLTGAHDLYFRIFDDLGVQRFTSGSVAVTLINGVATTQVPNVPQDVFDRFAPYRLDVSVDDPLFASPFPVDLTATPFAVNSLLAVSASNADTVDGSHAADFAVATHTHAGQDINSGIVDEAYIDADIARDEEVATAIDDHGDIPDRHHARYTDAEAVAAVEAAGVGLPAGVIVMWSGSLADIPDGWALCDGTNGTPDLRSKFIRSIPDDLTDPGGTGGSLTHTHGAGSYSAGSHTHSYSGTTSGASAQELCESGDPQHAAHFNHSHSYSGTTSSGGEGSVTGTSADESSLPPYYELAFIMKEQP